MNEIVLFKLISGEEIIGTVYNTTDTEFELEDSVTIAYHSAGDGKMSAGFAPHIPYAEGNIFLSKSAVAFRSAVKEDMLNEYKRIFGGIITPRQSIIA